MQTSISGVTRSVNQGNIEVLAYKGADTVPAFGIGTDGSSSCPCYRPLGLHGAGRFGTQTPSRTLAFLRQGSRENVKIRDIFLQHLSTPESIVPSPTAEAVSPKILQHNMGF